MTTSPSLESSDAPAVYVYIGTYTHKGSEGIYIYQFDLVSGQLLPVGSVVADNPSFLAVHPDKTFLYAVNELGQFEGEPTGAVSAFAIDTKSGMLSFLNQQPSLGQAPAHVSVGRAGKFVYVANYTSGTAAVLPVEADGTLAPASDSVQHVGSGLDPRRQQGPHAHSINLNLDNTRAYVADLGLDRVMIYDIATNPGSLDANAPAFAEVDGGSGPRHFTFHPSGRFAYLINEMGNTIVAFEVDPETGALAALQTVPTLPDDFEGPNTTADIHVHPTGNFVYGSNRGHNSIVIYAVDRESGKLDYVDTVSTEGATPRNFAIDPTGTYLLAANQDSDNVVIFRIDPESGRLTSTGHQVAVSMPVCVKFLVP
jgi:6-phosphogluconolactonase